ncbi:hypothetical protein [Streptomyces leeuwenhoekii]|uniref:Secreted Protein n=1 Tax=Streptomyces leeuwenhoekii TaxID=1437453 RepID=A0A0F7VQ42_STRLW|nr:hypothetical protein [Streptomyces leeuwenhoekii]CQR59497.1 Hypothetical Protein sle_00350 [Streptomyces leeuwenhoekii]
MKKIISALVAAATGALLAGTAHALPVHAQAGKTTALPSVASERIPAPPIGVDSPHSVYAANVPLQINILGNLTVDFKGGINLTPRRTTENETVFEVQNFRVEADTSPSAPHRGTLIVLKKWNNALTPLSVLQPSSGGRSEMLIYLSLTLEFIDKATGETVQTLHTDPTQYATLRATDVTSFPLVNQHFSLQEQVSFFQKGDYKPHAKLAAFDSVINGSA